MGMHTTRPPAARIQVRAVVGCEGCCDAGVAVGQGREACLMTVGVEEEGRVWGKTRGKEEEG